MVEIIQERSPLLRLPAELRDEIYRLATPLIHDAACGEVQTSLTFRSNGRPSPEPGLLRVNRQIRDEASAVYYKENEFIFEIENLNAKHYTDWCKLSATRLKANVVLDLQYEHLLNNPEAFRHRAGAAPGEDFHMPLDRQLWPNLLSWAEQYYCGNCLGVPWSKERDAPWEPTRRSIGYTNTAAAVFDLVDKLGEDWESTWPQIVNILSITFQAIGEANSAWYGVIKFR